MLVALNTKNLHLCAAGGVAAIGLVTQNLAERSGAYIVFTIIAYLTAREKAQALFDTWKTWLIRNNQAVVAVILLLVGALLLYRRFEFITMVRG